MSEFYKKRYEGLIEVLKRRYGSSVVIDLLTEVEEYMRECDRHE